ncbi:hypothetical protein [Gimesia algae]|uniref:Uncharacterized protein n=1 Tax=Gimesia algae TaxID=2527971 RepID=A0A517V8Y3_9PLAN|nr:hypothetical protein [Gimesia algae]QDT89463.1 hypothetical protein Pan161_10930 [Gimesia algae]
MREYYFREQRTQYQKCPGCQADIELDVDQCQFCDCNMAYEEQDSERESPNLSSPVASEPTSSCMIMLALNILVSLAGVFVTSTDRFPERPTYDHGFRLTEQEQDFTASLFQEHQRSAAHDNRIHSDAGSEMKSADQSRDNQQFE